MHRAQHCGPDVDVRAAVLQAEDEKALCAALTAAEAALSPESGVDALLATFAPLVPLIQAFFDTVLVMAKEDDLREARLALLQRIAALADGIVDLSKLEGF